MRGCTHKEVRYGLLARFSAFSASTTPIFFCHSSLRCLAARNICTNCSCSVHSSAVKVFVAINVPLFYGAKIRINEQSSKYI